ncbi:hypothetical protein Moror_7338 [Moniliophthora roreri MCA 2997]|uniref:Plastocyanin-like domain-containing protein n=2 Tax=Moniliophthora roreri TaxID=221103 RepID=V2X9X9_MONRO|nr:hypothetical protein Moror_7338 [Moniliophthora roreri MCA 2997]KAI3612246.1 hypothetical protein WG66_012104 [Moniliophthora roreri]
MFISALCFLLFWMNLVQAMPAWMGAPGQVSIGSLVPGAAYIEAKSAHRTGDVARHLAPSIPGNLGNLSIVPFSRISPPLFYINRNQLWQFQNQSAIFHVNVVNTTEPHYPTGEIPLQLMLDTQRKGIANGNFRWRGTMLHYDLGGRTNGGVYYHCPTPEGAKLLLFLKGVPTPQGCFFFTLHGTSQDY